MQNIFKRNSKRTNPYLRNNSTDLRLPMKTAAIGQKNISIRGAKLWNSLSAESEEASSRNSFKTFYWMMKAGVLWCRHWLSLVGRLTYGTGFWATCLAAGLFGSVCPLGMPWWAPEISPLPGFRLYFAFYFSFNFVFIVSFNIFIAFIVNISS